MCILIILIHLIHFKPGYDVINFEIKLIFLIKPFFQHTQKVNTKNLNILRTKRAFKIKQKAFFIIFEGLSLKQIRKKKLEGDSPTGNKFVIVIV